MFRQPFRAAQFLSITLALAWGFLLTTPLTFAADVVLIEEYWELQVGGPDQARSAPQVTMTMSPTADVDETFFVVTFNHWNYPSFASGGIQVQRWSGKECVEVVSGKDSEMLARDEEVVTWVQSLRVVNGQLEFEILDGNSDSWGTFGGGSALKLTKATDLKRLNTYRPAVSIGQSGIAYAGNRVSSLTLKKLRWQMSDGSYHELNATIDIATEIEP